MTKDASFSSIPALKRLGQNFLTDNNIIEKIIRAVAPQSNETVLEIGPGRGALTTRLLDAGARIVAVEFDRKLITLLEDKFRGRPNFTLIGADALVTDFCAIIEPATIARVVANLPYNISTAILQKLIEQRRCISEMIVMLQREVVDRITAAPGSTERGSLTVLIEAYATAERLFDVPAGAFRPAPKVWSSVIRLTLKPAGPSVKDDQLFLQIVRAGFAQRRKTILNNLRNSPQPLQTRVKQHGGASIVLCVAGVDLQRRAETLTLDEWVRVTNALD